jgi:hypothetical protein
MPMHLLQKDFYCTLSKSYSGSSSSEATEFINLAAVNNWRSLDKLR